MPFFFEAPTAGNDKILRRVASTMSFLDLKSLSQVARRYAPITRPRLFHHFGMAIWEEDHSIARCITLLAGDPYLAQCVHRFELRGYYDLPLPTLTLPNVYELLSLLPALQRLNITGFTWKAGHPVAQPYNPLLRHISMGSIIVDTDHDSPLGILNVVPEWDTIHITDIEHSVEPQFLDEATYRCKKLYLDHDPHADPAHSLPDDSEKFAGMETVVAHYVDLAHSQGMKHVLRGCHETLQCLAVVLNPTQYCEYSSSLTGDRWLNRTL